MALIAKKESVATTVTTTAEHNTTIPIFIVLPPLYVDAKEKHMTQLF